MANDRTKIAAAVISEMEQGESLRASCKKNDIGASTFLRWCDEDVALAEQYTRARKVRAELYADDIIRIADTTTDPAQARLQIDARKWIASKLHPRTYGDKLDVTSDGEKMPTVIINAPSGQPKP